MAGPCRLPGGLDRVFPDHRGSLGVALRREHRALVAGLTLDLRNPLIAREASRVATLRVRALVSAAAWGGLVEQRRVGQGRRPSRQLVERAAKRAALDDASAAGALDRLRELVGHGRRGIDLPTALRRLKDGA